MDHWNTIQKVIEQTRTIAVVGFSSQQHRAGYYVPAYLQRAGYRIFPVNPHIDQALGELAFHDLASIEQAVDLVLIFRRPEEIPSIINEAIAIKAKAIWMQLGIANADAASTAREAGMEVVMDACMMVEHRRSGVAVTDLGSSVSYTGSGQTSSPA
jgi:predicted CoA-binding protein